MYSTNVKREIKGFIDDERSEINLEEMLSSVEILDNKILFEWATEA